MSQAIPDERESDRGLAGQNPVSEEAVNLGGDPGGDRKSRLEIGGWEHAFDDEVFKSYISGNEPKFTVFKFSHIGGDQKWTKEKELLDENKTVTNALKKVDQRTVLRIVFIENVNEDAVQKAGSVCGLLSGDWRIATRWLSVPEKASFGANGMFIEVETIWKTMPPDTIPGFEERNSPHYDGPALLDKELENWARRRIGVLFSKQGRIWTFIVLVAPEKGALEVDGNSKSVTSPEKGFLHLRVENMDNPIANAHWRNGGLAYCKDGHNRVEDMINYIAAELQKQGPKFLECIARDVFWGWGEFLKQMRLPILQIREAPESHFHEFKNRHCWMLFRHRLILQYTELLSRAYKSLERAREAGIQLPFNLEDLEPSHDRIQSEVKEDEKLINDAISMIHNSLAFEKAEHSEKSSDTMECLSVLAAIFLPLSLFAGIFGMNIREFGINSDPTNPSEPKPPHWWLFMVVSVPSTFGLAAVIYVFFWRNRTQATRKARCRETCRNARSLC